MEHAFVIWDWKRQPCAEELSRLAQAGLVYFRYVDTQSDSYALVATKKKITDAQAQKLYETMVEELG